MARKAQTTSTFHDDVIKWKHFPRYWHLCEGNSSVTRGFPYQRPLTRSFDVFFDWRLNEWFSKQSGRRWFETPSHSLMRHCNVLGCTVVMFFITFKPVCSFSFPLSATLVSQHVASSALQGWGLLSQFSPFRYFPHFPLLSKQTLAIEYRVHIWQVSPQLSCGDTCQIWMWFRESNRYFCKLENFAYGEISERSFSNPHSRLVRQSFLFLYPEKSHFHLNVVDQN